jgi:hypothetical protein
MHVASTISTATISDDAVIDIGVNYSPPELETFSPATDDEVMKIIRSMSSASCELDPVPTAFV